MLARAKTGTIIGIDAHPVVVEAHREAGLPRNALIGLARGAVRESLTRVTSAIKATGPGLSGANRVANLLPAELPKEASALDLALAVAMLACDGQLPTASLQKRRFFGELSLGGMLEPVRGAVIVTDLARRCGDREIILPIDNAEEAAVIPGIRVVGACSLGEVRRHLTGEEPIPPTELPPHVGSPTKGCFSEVRGQRRAKRALEIAAAGGHNVLMVGPPGSGKTMLARRLPGILPPLSAEESIEVTRIHSCVGLLGGSQGLVRSRPFRAPHHTASEVALCGGGSIPKPGEVTLAHRGVLFLDEFPEFSRRALESLREPLEEGSIHVARAAMSLLFPANVLLVAAMNPCPCGRFRGDVGARAPARGAGASTCLCAFDQVVRYRSRISGPLLDRIDLHVAVESVPFRDYATAAAAEKSDLIRERVVAARCRQTSRLGPGRTNASMFEEELRRHVALGPSGTDLIEQAIDAHGLSARAIGRVRKTARTIADLQGTSEVGLDHLREALALRLLDRDLGQLGASDAA